MVQAVKVIREAASRFASSCSVNWDNSLPTVKISTNCQADIFMQGDEAADFITQIYALTKRYPSLDDYTVACFLAGAYA